MMTVEELRHPARTMDYDELIEGLEAARAAGAVYARQDGSGLVLWCYTSRCVYDSLWSPHAVIARGLVIDPAARAVVATPFPKFFNLGEEGRGFPDGEFEVFEKLDGSLIIIFHHDGRWRTATKGAFDSAQAIWAGERLATHDLSALDPSTTYLAEAIYPENRIVVPYDESQLVLLAAYDAEGLELEHGSLCEVAEALGWRAAERFSFASESELVVHAADLPKTEEGFVIRFGDGLRLKLKGAEYRRIHALISRVTPLAMWEAMAAGDDLESIRRDLPEEFWGDFDQIIGLLQARLAGRVAEVEAAAARVAALSDKELGLGGGGLEPDIRNLVFARRRYGPNFATGRSGEALMRWLRPTGNALPGYVASYAMARLLEEAG